MKTKNLLTLTLLMLSPGITRSQPDPNWLKDSGNQQRKFLWSEINAGYSNHGPAGSLTVQYRKGNLVLSSQYNKSHVCYEDHATSEYFLNAPFSDNHLTVESMSLSSGIILPGKWHPSFLIGISWSQFKYISTAPIENDVTLPRIWATIINRNYRETRLSTRTIRTMGIPVEFKLHFSSSHFIGFDAGIKADVNMQSTSVSAELGIRLGRLNAKRPSLKF